MRRPGKWILRLSIGAAVLILLVLFVVPLAVQTSWARNRVRDVLEQQTGRSVSLGSLSFSWFSGLTVKDVTVEQKQKDLRSEGPLFKLGGLTLDVGFFDLLSKKLSVDRLSIDGPEIVLVRDRQGRFNIADLLGEGEPESTATGVHSEAPVAGGPSTSQGAGKGGGRKMSVSANLDVSGGRLLYVDEQVGTRVELDNLSAEATWNDGKLVLQKLNGQLNGGAISATAHVDLSTTPPAFRVEGLTMKDVRFQSDLSPLSLFFPLMGTKPALAQGTLSFTLDSLSGRGFDMASLTKTLEGKGSISLSGGVLASQPVASLFGALQSAGAGNLSSLGSGGGKSDLSLRLMSATFSISDGKITSNDMTIDAGKAKLGLSGFTKLDGTLNYLLKMESLSDLLAQNSGLKRYVKSGDTLPLSLQGTAAHPRVSLDVSSVMERLGGSLLKKKFGKDLPGGLGGLLPGGGKK